MPFAFASITNLDPDCTLKDPICLPLSWTIHWFHRFLFPATRNHNQRLITMVPFASYSHLFQDNLMHKTVDHNHYASSIEWRCKWESYTHLRVPRISGFPPGWALKSELLAQGAIHQHLHICRRAMWLFWKSWQWKDHLCLMSLDQIAVCEADPQVCMANVLQGPPPVVLQQVDKQSSTIDVILLLSISGSPS